MSARAAFPAAGSPATPTDDPVVDLSSFYRWFDARTVFVPTSDKSRWTPAVNLHADYVKWQAAVGIDGDPLTEQQFETALREDTRLAFEMLEVRKDFASDSEMAVCANRALRAALKSVG